MKIHFIGIGGIGVSALAQYYLKKGCQVTGSDLVTSEITQALKKKGIKITIGKNVIKKDADLIIYSPAVNPASFLNKLRFTQSTILKRGGVLSYPEALGQLTKKYFTIAISGTHGKSTTTAMVGLILTKAGLDPTVIVGTKLKEFKDSNCRVGESKYLVIEADEHLGSFLNYWPEIIVLTIIEKDHLDYYKNFKNLLRVFKKYIGHLPKNGIVVASKSIPKTILATAEMVSYFSLEQKEAKKLRKILKVPGEYNVFNALAALTAARALKIPDEISFKALSEYRGSWRRFEERELKIENCCVGTVGKLKIISDYAHHPTEIKVTLKAAREKYPRKKIWCVYQPHQYQRTFYLFNDFIKVFKKAPVDKLIITDIYDVAGREEEEIKEKINSKKLVGAIGKPWAIYISTPEEAKNYLKKNLRGREVVIIMGAGDIYNLIFRLTEKERK